MIKILVSEGAPKRASKRALKGPPESGFRRQKGNLRGLLQGSSGALIDKYLSIMARQDRPSK